MDCKCDPMSMREEDVAVVALSSNIEEEEAREEMGCDGGEWVFEKAPREEEP